MKKILTVVIAVLMLASLTVSSYAANGAFVQSPSASNGPVIVDVGDGDCDGGKSSFEIIPYGDRGELDDNGTEMESAYNSIASASADLGKLGSAVKKIAESCKVATNKLAVFDLFAIVHDCDANNHGEFVITLNAKNIKNFAGVMHFVDGKWVLVESELDDRGNIIITTDNLDGPFAFVVHDGTGVAQSNDYTLAIVLAVSAGVMALVLVAIVFKKKTL